MSSHSSNNHFRDTRGEAILLQPNIRIFYDIPLIDVINIQSSLVTQFREYKESESDGLLLTLLRRVTV